MPTALSLTYRSACWLLAVALLLLTACGEHPPPAEPEAAAPPPLQTLAPTTHRELRAAFTAHGYAWQTLDQGVPPLVVEKLPPDLHRIDRPQERKELFFLSLLPMVLLINEEVSLQREELLELLARHEARQPLRPAQQTRLTELAADYKVEGNPLADPEARAELLKRVDVLPPSIVLAQAATESGFGTSSIARRGNNLFGEFGYTAGGEFYQLRIFPSLMDSVRSYIRNLNTHEAYQWLREHRASRRASGEPAKGHDLAAGLRFYSEREEAYVQDIRRMIRGNRLSLLSSLSLRNPAGAAEPEPPADNSAAPAGPGQLKDPRSKSRRQNSRT